MLISGVAARIRSLRGKAIHFRRFHPAMSSLRIRSEQSGFITCSGKSDGPGAQALAIMSTILFAHDAGMTYVHSPFQRIQHNANGDPDWEKKWEFFFNLGKGEISREQFVEKGAECVQVTKLSEIPEPRSKTLYVARHCHEYGNYFPDRYLALSNRFAEKYCSSSKGELRYDYDEAKLNVAIHVRRGDVAGWGPTANRFTSNEFVASVIRQVLNVAAGYAPPFAVRLYSEGRVPDFGPLSDMPVEFHLNECPFSTLNNLVNADVLLMSKSTFSFVAGLLSRGVKIFEPYDPTSFVHRPLSSWLIAGNGGKLDQRMLRRALERALCRRATTYDFVKRPPGKDQTILAKPQNTT